MVEPMYSPWGTVDHCKMLCYDEQINLFYDAEKNSRIEALDKAVEEIRSRYGYNAIKNATLLQNPKMPSHNSPKLIMPTGVPQ